MVASMDPFLILIPDGIFKPIPDKISVTLPDGISKPISKWHL